MPLAIKTVNFNYECGSAATAALNLCISESVWDKAGQKIEGGNFCCMCKNGLIGNITTGKRVTVDVPSVGAHGVSSILYCVPSGRTAKVIPQVHTVEYIHGKYARRYNFAEGFCLSWCGGNSGGFEVCTTSAATLCCVNWFLYMVASASFCPQGANSGYFCLQVGNKNVLPAYNHVLGQYSVNAGGGATGGCTSANSTLGLRDCIACNGTIAAITYTNLTNELGVTAPNVGVYQIDPRWSCVDTDYEVKNDDLVPYFYLQAGDCIAINFCNRLSNNNNCTAIASVCYNHVAGAIYDRGICHQDTSVFAAAGNRSKIQLQYIIIEESAT